MLLISGKLMWLNTLMSETEFGANWPTKVLRGITGGKKVQSPTVGEQFCVQKLSKLKVFFSSGV